MLFEGRGVRRDTTASVIALTRACNAGNAEGCANLGIMYADRNDVPRDPDRARAFFRRACDQGLAWTCTSAAEVGEASLPLAR
jgi:TPR repeat protein